MTLAARLGPGLDWRHPVRMTLAATAAFLVGVILHLPEGYWAVLSALIVTRPHLGGTMDAARDRLLGTVCGAALALAAASLRRWQVPELVLLLGTLAPLGVVIAWRPAWRTAPIAAVIVLSAAPQGGSAVAAAGWRVVEIALGAGLGVAASWLFFRADATDRLERLAARILVRFADLLGGAPGEEGRAALIEANRADLRRLVALSRTAQWDRGGAAHAERLAAAMSRLQADASVLLRTASAATPDDAAPLVARAHGLAAALAGRTPWADRGRAAAAMPADISAARRFLLATFGQDLEAIAGLRRS